MTEAAANDDILRKIQGLISKAEGTDNENERELFRKKADELMQKWQVESWQLDEARAARGEVRQQKVGQALLFSTSEFREEFMNMAWLLAEAMGVRAALHTNSWRDGRPAWEMTAIGYEVDLRYLQMLFSSLMLEAAATLEAKPDTRYGFDENVYRLHESAVQWERVRDLMNDAVRRGAPWETIPGRPRHWDADQQKYIPGASDGGVMLRAYRRHCELIGVEPHTIVGGKRYRASFVKGFTSRVVIRFRQIRNAGQTQALVLAQRKEQVDDVFESMFKELVPVKMKDKTGGRMLDAAFQCGTEAANKADLSRLGSKVESQDYTRPELSS